MRWKGAFWRFGSQNKYGADQEYRGEGEEGKRHASLLRRAGVVRGVEADHGQRRRERIDIAQQSLLEEEHTVSGEEGNHRTCHKQSGFTTAECDNRQDDDVHTDGENRHLRQGSHKDSEADIGQMGEDAGHCGDDQAVDAEKHRQNADG